MASGGPREPRAQGRALGARAGAAADGRAAQMPGPAAAPRRPPPFRLSPSDFPALTPAQAPPEPRLPPPSPGPGRTSPEPPGRPRGKKKPGRLSQEPPAGAQMGKPRPEEGRGGAWAGAEPRAQHRGRSPSEAEAAAADVRGGRKKRQAGVELNLGQVLAALQRQHRAGKEQARPRARPLVFAVSGSAPPKGTAAKGAGGGPALVPHNPLDSSAPLVKKGKQRLVPKPKKPTPLKKIILKEREERRQQRLLEQAGPGNPSHPGPPEPEAGPGPAANGAEDPGDPGDPGPAPPEAPAPVPAIHSRRFREYCRQLVPRELDACVWELLRALRGFQERCQLREAARPRPKRRLVLGLREVRKHLRLRRLAAVLLSPDCEAVRAKGGLDELLREVVTAAGQQGVPLVFALSRRALGRCLDKPVPVSGVGVFSYDGAQDHFRRMLELSEAARRGYQRLVAASAAPGTPDPPPAPAPGSPPPAGRPPGPAAPRRVQVWRREPSDCRPPDADPDPDLDPALTLAGLDLGGGGETPAGPV